MEPIPNFDNRQEPLAPPPLPSVTPQTSLDLTVRSQGPIMVPPRVPGNPTTPLYDRGMNYEQTEGQLASPPFVPGALTPGLVPPPLLEENAHLGTNDEFTAHQSAGEPEEVSKISNTLPSELPEQPARSDKTIDSSPTGENAVSPPPTESIGADDFEDRHAVQPEALTPPIQEVTIGEKTLLISPQAVEAMAELDRFVAERNITTEVGGWGLTREVEGKLVLEEFIGPDPDKIFEMKTGFFMSPGQDSLMRLLGSSLPLELTVSDEGAAIAPAGEEDVSQWITFPNREHGIWWEMTKRNVEALTGLSLPDTTEELKALVQERNAQEGRDPSSTSLPLKTDWEQVISGTACIHTSAFMDRVTQRALETGTEVNFNMHHHPTIGLGTAMLEDGTLANREAYYDRLLEPSQADIRALRAQGVDFFEIRALGTVEDPSSRTSTTSRRYRVSDFPVPQSDTI